MPSETSFDRFRRHFPTPPPPFQWAFFIKRKISRHSHESGNQGLGVGETVLSDKFPHRQLWIPACAGMTGFLFLIFCFCGNDGMRVFVRHFCIFLLLL
ncbi:hypothetical protein OIF95_03390 [Neisseria meningitidis]|uniref:hypothetical protein n=1 Tax=Neisseria meningitidis TaxID=487 RepID=UPI0021F1FEF1|nr:hypothetical protein [Neisseria meningitidis]MCV6716074.1 hypothetical protein [Neisseria meningitidis]